MTIAEKDVLREEIYKILKDFRKGVNIGLTLNDLSDLLLSEPEQTEPDYKQMWKALEKRVNSFTGFSEEWIRDEMRNCMKLAHDNTEIEKDCDNCDNCETCKHYRKTHVLDICNNCDQSEGSKWQPVESNTTDKPVSGALDKARELAQKYSKDYLNESDATMSMHYYEQAIQQEQQLSNDNLLAYKAETCLTKAALKSALKYKNLCEEWDKENLKLLEIASNQKGKADKSEQILTDLVEWLEHSTLRCKGQSHKNILDKIEELRGDK